MKHINKFKRFLSLFLTFLMIYTFSSVNISALTEFSVSCRSCILVDVKTGQVIYEQNADSKQYPASLTKIMTSIVVFKNADLDSKVTVSHSALSTLDPDGSAVGLVEGEVLSVRDLLYCLLVPSGNDAAVVLAEYVGGTISNFVSMMNDEAKNMGLTNTHFMNPHGMHDDSHYTTARDLYIITRNFMNYPELYEISNTVSYVVEATNKSQSRVLNSTNYLISGINTYKYLYTYARGIKTGTTTPAGYCLISSAEKNGLFLVSVVLGCGKDEVTNNVMSFVETKRLFEYGFVNFSNKVLVDKDQPVIEVAVKNGIGADSVVAVTEESVTSLLSNTFNINDVILTPWLYGESVSAPVVKGQALGEVDVSYNGVSYGRVKLVALNDIEQSDFLNKIDSFGELLNQKNFKMYFLGGIAGIIVLILLIVIIHNRRKKKKIKKGGYII